MDVFCIDSVVDSIEVRHIVLMVWLKSPQSQLSKTFCGLKIENRLNIKKVMGRNVWMCFDSSIDSLNKHSIQCIVCFDLHIDSVDKQDTIHNIQ